MCAVDAASKALAVAGLSPHESVTLLGGLITLHLYRNPGAAFGIGPSYTVIYALIEAAVLAAILRLSRRLRSWPWAIALGLLLGGAAGNLADRLFRSPGPLRGFVIDWIKLPYFPPTFNIADSAIPSARSCWCWPALAAGRRQPPVRSEGSAAAGSAGQTLNRRPEDRRPSGPVSSNPAIGPALSPA